MLIEQITDLPNNGQTNGKVEAQIRNVKYALRSTTTANDTKHQWTDHIWKMQHSLNKAISTATGMSPEMAMFGHEIPLRKTTLLQRVDQTEQQNPMATRIPFEARKAILAKHLRAQQSRLDQQNETRQENSFQKGDIVWKRIMQRSGPGTRHTLDQRYPGPFKIVDITWQNSHPQSRRMWINSSRTVSLRTPRQALHGVRSSERI